MPFKMHKNIFFPEKKYVCLPCLKFSDPRYQKHSYSLFGLSLANKWNSVSQLGEIENEYSICNY